MTPPAVRSIVTSVSVILAAVDLDVSTPAVARLAEDLAARLDAELWLVHVAAPEPDSFVSYEIGPQSVRDEIARHVRDQHRELQRLAGDIRARGLVTSGLLVQGPTAETLVKKAGERGAEFLVVGRGKGGLRHVIQGSVSEEVVKHAPCPVVVVPPEASPDG